MALMDNDRSGTATFNEFSGGLTAANFDLRRDECMRLFKAVDVNGDRSLSIEELREHLYGKGQHAIVSGGGGGSCVSRGCCSSGALGRGSQDRW